MKLSVVMPVYNEEATQRRVVERVLSVEPNFELLCVDDGSREILAELQSRFPQMRVFLQPQTTLRRGIQEAIGDLVIIQDADLGYDPSDYPRIACPRDHGCCSLAALLPIFTSTSNVACWKINGPIH